ncbi:methylated-DNA--[protein]-cysteine S-methyltransferase [Mesoterricola silvestris]|uniref:Methylated-DNA--protein-cysteine methyltransferase n=1 Tax=Mesoterricola silvestris TaxID=2927979 RepID=A0AA48GNE0_9BACT|nr:methylated-DNA--[protein]-cysteine S-methyltransferase [Mesoterricola silvestris]BDU73064.1 methylated-DNA--protein-cysteine methyltransferase [Mesoterricola silvestris]
MRIWNSPLGPLALAADAGGALCYLGFADHEPRPRLLRGLAGSDPAVFAPVERQLDEYFRGVRAAFDLPLAPRGTPFQLRVWEELRRIPPGRTLSYGDLARRLGDPRLARAVGAANGANPISIIIPCHRLLGAGGGLTGYAGGLDRKRALLELEGGIRT